jgi:iron complex outermembrane receptor protein
MVAMWERHGRGRLGIEAYYTGTQSLDDNPYRRTGRPYVELGILGEITVGKISLFLNLENILDVRQTRYHPLTLPQRAPDGRWTVDAWAPTDGFVVNGGMRFRF